MDYLSDGGAREATQGVVCAQKFGDPQAVEPRWLGSKVRPGGKLKVSPGVLGEARRASCAGGREALGIAKLLQNPPAGILSLRDRRRALF